MNETTKSDMIMITHHLKRLTGSSYHQKRIDIIITDTVHYFRNGGIWKQKNVVIHPYAMATFTRSDGQLQINNGTTLMGLSLTHNDFDGAFIISNGNGANVTNLPVGDYSVYASLALSSAAGWLNLGVNVESGITMLGPNSSEVLTGGEGFTRLNLATVLRGTQANTKIWASASSNVSGTMREKGFMFITRLG